MTTIAVVLLILTVNVLAYMLGLEDGKLKGMEITDKIDNEIFELYKKSIELRDEYIAYLKGEQKDGCNKDA